MSCDETKVEDINIRLQNYSVFNEPHKKNLIKSKSKWCNECNFNYKNKTCKKVSDVAKKYKLQSPSDTYIEDVKSLEKMCKNMMDSITRLNINIKDMNLDALELVKQEILSNSKELTETIEGCFNDRVKFKNNCIFDKNTKLSSSDKGHNDNINLLSKSLNSCKSVLDLTSNDDDWKKKIKDVYEKDYPVDNIYYKPVSRKRLTKKKSSRGSKRTIKKVGKNKGKVISKRRMTKNKK